MKKDIYERLVTQIESLMNKEDDLIANMANIAAVLKQNFNFLWVGFYRVNGGELRLGPFQGPVACTRIAYNKGVCGATWKEKRTIIVPDVHQFSGHIACSSESLSEIVVPVFQKNEVIAVLDIDSAEIDTFDEIDSQYLEKICAFFR
ncbi:hypothetical protein FACS1894172_17050 [Spirochaetia bacterium]|nr:hypothetical protein FACS1894172_17050 [Spirochaetia bacterium]